MCFMYDDACVNVHYYVMLFFAIRRDVLRNELLGYLFRYAECNI